MEQMITANIALDIFGIILSLIPVVYTLSYKRWKQRLNQYFLGVAVSNIFMIIGDLADWLLQNPTGTAEKNILAAFSALFYTASAFVLYFFAGYITEYLKLTGRVRKLCIASVAAVCVVQTLFALLSPFTGSIFCVTDEGYQRGPLFLISQFIPLFCYVLFTVLVIVYHRKLKTREVVFFLLYIFVPLGGGAAQMFTRGIAVVNICVALALLFILVNIQFEHEIRLREQEKELTEQRIDLMLSQIQPHYLYNSLGVIYRLCEIDSKKARQAIRIFSDFLRGNMDSLKAHKPIPFEKELEHVRNYLYLEQQRFGDRLRVIYRIETANFLIPPLTLQPLVENAVQHGIYNKKEGGTIIISTEEADGYIVVRIEDNGIGMEMAKSMQDGDEHAHVGLANVRSRLEEMAGGSMTVESSEGGTVVTIQIPWNGGFS